FYRYVPNSPGHLLQGGRLQALRIRGMEYFSADTASGFRDRRNVALPCEWVDIENYDPDNDTVRYEAHAKGAAKFSRGEGMWYGSGRIYFCCSDGGDLRK